METKIIERSQQDILNRIANIEQSDFFGFGRSDLLEFLDFEHAKQFLVEEATSEVWEDARAKGDSIYNLAKAKIVDYMSFAWDKANSCRGLSAGRSIAHMQEWAWLMGDEKLIALVNDTEYEFYGKPTLVAICEYLQIDWKQYDNNRWRNSEMQSGVSAEEALGRR